ncbi:gephyrin-like molybdotransferase Glp [Paragemmobacter straminiformis]|uniref:Molybdopterin molybdenumtransferase n=1 Tax=Paragemmobacter straminiformis TaxID=2045119 RepID=A0A842I802_9RHOB|nr:gephyrin-like molybdotransferase Glp [Gemmobacter straminiformis]MBC2835701.1 molybdopterin molybdotransferase MoeA [Gemmobacter straminiformis]
MISVEEALARCFDLVAVLPTETVALRHAAERVMAVPAVARRDQPPFAASAMDGYAVAGDPVAGDSFDVIGEAGAGHAFHGAVGAGQAVRIFTGAPVPQGATRVVIQEDVTREGARITLKPDADTGTHIRPKGQDFRAGATIAPRLLRPNDLALLAAMNVAEVQVTRRPVVAIIATGDELVMPGEDPAPDQIIASNSFALAAMVEAAGGEARLLPIARDTEAELFTVLSMAGSCDLIVTIGGASVGDHDLVGRVAESMGLARAFYKIAMRPGKPLMAGRLRGVPMLGLPGNPVSSIVCGHLFLLPMMRAMLGLGAAGPEVRQALLAEALPANGPRAHYMRARLSGDRIAPFERQDSALITILTEADALLVRPVSAPPAAAGDVVDYIAL